MRIVGRGPVTGKLSLDWECLDYFFRPAGGRLEVEVPTGRAYLARIDLPPGQVRRIFRAGSEAGADCFRLTCRLREGDAEVGSARADLRISPAPPPPPKLAPLPERWETLPEFGRVRLIDEVLCGDPADPHAMRQGGKGLQAKSTSEPLDYYGGSKRLNFDWAATYRDTRDEFTRIAPILGAPCRVTENWGWFAYRMGRGLVAPTKHYVLAIDYPEDVSRSFLIWNALDSSASIGFHTGSSLGDPHTRQRFMQRVDLPLSGRYERHYSLMTATTTEGWIGLHSMGAKADPFAQGIAVRAIRLYELGGEGELARLALPVREPEGLPHRLLGFLQEDQAPSAALDAYRFWGMNLYAPLTLSYCGGTYETNSGYVDWSSKLFGPDGVTNPHALAKPPYYRVREGSTAGVLAAADASGMTILPVLEYGGTGQLPVAALAVRPDGSFHGYHWGTTVGPDGRRTMRTLTDGTCLDMAHPAVGEDLARLLTEVATEYAGHKSFGGVVLTHRFAAWQIGYGDGSLQRFARERGLTLPTRDAGKWVQANHEAAFRAWHYGEKRRNLLQARDALRRVRPDLRLVILNYNGGDDNLHFGTPLYWWDRERGDELLSPGQVALPDFSRLDLARMIEDYTRPDVDILSVGMNPPLYAQDRGLWNLAPAHYPFLCGNARYLEHFRTGEGSAVCLWWIYNEDAFRNFPEPGWACPGLNGNEPAGRACMLDEVLTVASADPCLLAVRMGAMNRGFPQFVREFSAAYRALPALPSRVVAACEDPHVVVRRIDTARGGYVAVINTHLGPAPRRVELRTQVLGGGAVRNLVTGELLRSPEGAPISLTLPPVSLTSLRVEGG